MTGPAVPLSPPQEPQQPQDAQSAGDRLRRLAEQYATPAVPSPTATSGDAGDALHALATRYASPTAPSAATPPIPIARPFNRANPLELTPIAPAAATASSLSVQIPEQRQPNGLTQLAHRNNNPGNLKFENQQGAELGDSGFARFASPEDGYKALRAQIDLDAQRGHTVASFAQKYAPPKESSSVVTAGAPQRPAARSSVAAPSLPNAPLSGFQAEATRVGDEKNPGHYQPGALEQILTTPLALASQAAHHPIDFAAQTATLPVRSFVGMMSPGVGEARHDPRLSKGGNPTAAPIDGASYDAEHGGVTNRERTVAGLQTAANAVAPGISRVVGQAAGPVIGSLLGDDAAGTAIGNTVGHMAASAPIGASYSPDKPFVGAAGLALTAGILNLGDPQLRDATARAAQAGQDKIASILDASRQARERAGAEGAAEGSRIGYQAIARAIGQLDPKHIAYIQRDPVLGPLSRPLLENLGKADRGPDFGALADVLRGTPLEPEESLADALRGQSRTGDVLPAAQRPPLLEPDHAPPVAPKPSTEPTPDNATSVPLTESRGNAAAMPPLRAAVRVDDGRIFTGVLHADAAEAAHQAGAITETQRDNGHYHAGFLTRDGQYLNRQEAFEYAKQHMPDDVDTESSIRGQQSGGLDATDLPTFRETLARPNQPPLRAAIRTPDGRTFEAPVHVLAAEEARKAGADLSQGFESGFTTPDGRFLSREEALQHAERDELPNVNTRAARLDDNQLDSVDIRGREQTPTREVASPPLTHAGEQLHQLAEQYAGAEEVPHIRGRQTRALMRNGEALPAEYRVISANDVQSSHDPFSFAPNPRYPEGVQGRDYQRNRAAQDAVARRSLEFSPDIALNPSEMVSEGAPTILPNGTVLAGNERSMLPRRAAVHAPDRYAAYVDQLKARAHEFGIDPNAIDTIDRPLLVRALTDARDVQGGPQRWAEINRLSDEVATKGKSAAEEGAARASQLANASDALDHLSRTLDPEQTIATYLGTPDGRTFVGKLVEDGVINDAELSRYTDAKGGLTEDGRLAVRRMLLSTAVSDPTAILDAPAAIVNKIEQAVPSIVTTKGTDFDITEMTTAALKMAAEARDNAVTIADLASQAGLFGDTRRSPDVTTLASFLTAAKPNAVKSAFRRYAALAREAVGNAETTDMFGGTGFDTPAAAFREAFGNASDTRGARPGVLPEPERASDKLFAQVPIEQRRTSAPTRAGELIAEARSPRAAGVGRALGQDREAPTPDVAVRSVNRFTDALRKVFAPTTRGPEAKATGFTVREHDAALVQRFEQAKAALMDFARVMDRLPVRDQLEFIDRIERGRAQPTPALEQLATTMRHLLDSARDDIRALGDGQLEHWIENYFPHIWADPARAKSVIASIMSKRSLTGPGSFLKRRVIPTIAEGMDAGLVPVTFNPIDLTLLKLREMHRYLAGQRILKEMQGDGRLRFVSSFDKSPVGYEQVNDKVSTVYGPPRVTVTEAFDFMVRSKLESVMRELGITHERRPNIGGGSSGGVRLGFARGESNITTRSATPESVIEHELGHSLDARLGLWQGLHDYPGNPKAKEAVAYRKAVTQELRDLADLRHEGIENVDPEQHKYIRSRPEKVANAVMGLIYAPERMRQVAPTVYGRLREILSSDPTTAKILDIKPSFRHGADTFDVKTPGMVVLGHWYAPEPVARVVNNYLSPGVSETALGPFFDVYRGAGNLLNMAQLGLSAYHLGFTSLDAIVSRNALGVLQLRDRQIGNAAMSFASSPAAPITTAIKGFRLKQAYLRGTTDPALAQIVDGLIAGGGRVKMDEFYGGTAWRQAKLALHDAGALPGREKAIRYAEGVGKMFPAAVEQSTAWLMQHVVPWQKLGVFYDLAQHELAKLPPGADRMQVRAVMARAWDSVENRMGQLTYNNLFWHRWLKDGLMSSVRSVGWNLGTWRELPGGVSDLAQAAAHRQLNVSPRASYVIALPATVALLGGVYHYLHTGSVPSSLKDWFFPRTGQKNAGGSDERVQLPSYMRDIFDYSHSFGGTLANKAHPLGVAVADMLANKDFYGNMIRNPDDPFVREMAQEGQFIAGQFAPFGARNMRDQLHEGQSFGTSAQSFVGITPAPRREVRSRAEQRMSDLLARRGVGGATPEQIAQRSGIRDTRNQLRRGLENNDTTSAGAALRALADQYGAGSITRRQAMGVLHTAETPSAVDQFKKLTPTEALDVYQLATPAEQQQFAPILATKLRGPSGRSVAIPRGVFP